MPDLLEPDSADSDKDQSKGCCYAQPGHPYRRASPQGRTIDLIRGGPSKPDGAVDKKAQDESKNRNGQDGQDAEGSIYRLGFIGGSRWEWVQTDGNGLAQGRKS